MWLVVVVCLFAAAPALSAASILAADDAPGAELSRLAKALRTDPSRKNYDRLARFAQEYRESELSAQASFALGMADFNDYRWSDARARFDEARTSFWLRDYATLYLARSEAELGALESAQRRLEEFSFDGTLLEDEAAVLVADIWLRLERPRRAVAWLSQQRGVEYRPPLLYALGQAQRAAGSLEAAAKTLQGVYYELPLSSEAEPSKQLLGELEKELKQSYPEPGVALRRARAEKLWTEKAYRGARAAYVDLGEHASGPLRTEARLRAAIALYRLRAASRACRELKQLGSVPAALEGALRSYRARCALHDGDYKRAETDLKFLEQNHPSTEWSEAALYDAGSHALARGEERLAREYFRRAAEAWPEGDRVPAAHWKLTWLTFRRRRQDAVGLLEEHIVRFPHSVYQPRALYWRARLAMDTGQNRLAHHLLGQLRRLAPHDYLAQQAEQLQGRLGAPTGNGELPDWLQKLALPIDSPVNTPLSARDRRRLDRAALFDRLGLWNLAERDLEAAFEETAHLEIALARARIAMSQEKYALASERLRRAFPRYWRAELDVLPREAWEIMFPRPYWELIEREARRNRLDPFLVAGLIRQESRFESTAVSYAGALGLMQLMPRTARDLARMGRLSRNRILDPDLNVRLGTRFLRQLLDRFDGDLEKAVAVGDGNRSDGGAGVCREHSGQADARVCLSRAEELFLLPRPLWGQPGQAPDCHHS
jgi:soluble lytic murein transglycosylase